MSWWDYGYQIAGMANRTTLVDNNTWNNSHIALVNTGSAYSVAVIGECSVVTVVVVVVVIVCFSCSCRWAKPCLPMRVKLIK